MRDAAADSAAAGSKQAAARFDLGFDDGDFGAGGDAAPIVLKFGSSILRSQDDLPSVVTELYRHVRRGRKVVAIVSAFEGDTDRLYADAQLFEADFISRHAPSLIGLGEARSAAMLAIACDRTGLDAAVLDARQLGLQASGPFDDALPNECDAGAVRAALQDNDVVIAPGFVAFDDKGAPVLLGRGGSDVSAIVVAVALGAPFATLIKDAPGVFDRDPFPSGGPAGGVDPDAQFFDRINWSSAAQRAGVLIQEKSLQFAAEQDLAVHIGALGAGAGTLVSAEETAPRAFVRERPTRVGVAGLGIVGEGAALRLLADAQRFELVSALVSNPDKPRHRQINPSLITTDPSVFLDAKPDVIVDLMSSGSAGATLMREALEAGVSVVSANKQAVAEDLPGLQELAAKRSARLAYGAAVGGGAPMVETVVAARARGAVKAIDAVLNGTVNYILSELQKGASFDTALKAAQDAGFAEADPSADLSGDDARAKATILAYEAFGVGPDAIDFTIEGLDAQKGAEFVAAGGAWRQVTRVRPSDGGRVAVAVAYERVDDDAFMSGLQGEANAVRVELQNGEILSARGRGAGRIPTVESVLGDLGAFRRSRVGA